MSTRPRPRPKPRARVPSSAPPSSPGPSSNSLPPVRKAKTPIVIDDEDEDALFIRKPRTVDAWRKLDRIAEDKPKDKVINLDSSDEEHKTSSSPARKNKKSMMKPRVRQSSNSSLPAWTRDEDALQSSSSESDDELLDFIEKPVCGSKRSSREPERRQRKRQRSRSKSLTPPPAVPADKIKDARERVRRMLNEGREPLPTTTFLADDSYDNIELDPELAKIAAQVKQDSARQQSEGPIHSRGVTPVLDGGPETVTVKVRWKYHPLNKVAAAAKPQIWGFKLKRHDSFNQVFMEVADLAEILPENVIISYNKKRVFSSASPHGIGVWAEAELEACDKNTYEYIRSNPTRAPSLVPQDLQEITNIHRPLSPTIEEPEYKSPEPESQPEKDEDDDKFKLILRGKDVKDVTLTVRPTTKCSAIIKAFLKSAGLTEKFTASAAPPPPAKGRGRKKAAPPVAAVPPMPQLVVDGDKLDPESEIREADLEDGDMVEVSGL